MIHRTAELSHAVKGADYFGHARTEIAPLLPARASRVLEIGCGSGATLAWLRQSGRCDRTVGIELVERVAHDARSRVDRVEVGDAEDRLDDALRDGPFDLVLCLDVLEHLADPWRFLGRLGERLPRGATLIASVPNVRHWRVSVPLLFLGRFDYAEAGVLDRTHLRFFTRRSVSGLFDARQFDVLSVTASRPPAATWGQLAGLLTLGLAKDLLAVQYLVAARRR